MHSDNILLIFLCENLRYISCMFCLFQSVLCGNNNSKNFTETSPIHRMQYMQIQKRAITVGKMTFWIVDILTKDIDFPVI